TAGAGGSWSDGWRRAATSYGRAQWIVPATASGSRRGASSSSHPRSARSSRPNARRNGSTIRGCELPVERSAAKQEPQLRQHDVSAVSRPDPAATYHHSLRNEDNRVGCQNFRAGRRPSSVQLSQLVGKETLKIEPLLTPLTPHH